MDNKEILGLLQLHENVSDLHLFDDEIDVDIVEQQLESSDTKQDISTYEDDLEHVPSEH